MNSRYAARLLVREDREPGGRAVTGDFMLMFACEADVVHVPAIGRVAREQIERETTTSEMALRVPLTREQSAASTDGGGLAPNSAEGPRNLEVRSIPPWQLGITGAQLLTLVAAVKTSFTESNPTVYMIVDGVVKPACCAANVPYALLVNPGGLLCETFVSHAWGESFFEFVKTLQRCYAEDFATRAFWICFLANPQTLSPRALKRLLGHTIYQSPFYLAMTRCKEVLIVRNKNLNLYIRLWCVVELALALEYAKIPIKVHGEMPDFHEMNPDRDMMGTKGKCFEGDRDMIVESLAQIRVDVDKWVAEVIQIAPGTQIM